MSNKRFNIAVIGATGNVGREVLELLDERDFPIDKLFLLASKKSVGEELSFKNKTVKVSCLDDFSFDNIHIAIASVGSSISKKFIDKATKSGTIVIDEASIFRVDKDIPLIVPEVNIKEINKYTKKSIISSPNCVVVPIVVALNNLHKEFEANRISISTYQSVSGRGKLAMDELFYQTKRMFEMSESKEQGIFEKRIAFNCIPQIGEFLDDGYTEEESKIEQEVKKILGSKLKITSTCVRVPVFNCHAISLNVQFKNKCSLTKVRNVLAKTDGVMLLQDNKYTTQMEATKLDPVFVSRIREDKTLENSFNMWIVSDNLRKGAALNVVQIAEELIKII